MLLLPGPRLLWDQNCLHCRTNFSHRDTRFSLKIIPGHKIFWKSESAEARIGSSHSSQPKKTCQLHGVESGGHKWWRTYWCWRMLLTQGKCFWKIWTNRVTRLLRKCISIKGANLGLTNLDIFHWFSSPIIAAPKWSSWVYVDACGVNGWLS